MKSFIRNEKENLQTEAFMLSANKIARSVQSHARISRVSMSEVRKT